MDQTDTKGKEATAQTAMGQGVGALRLRQDGPSWETGEGPTGGTGEALVQIECAGLCRTDLLVADGTLPATDGLVLGHEAAGRVLSCSQPSQDQVAAPATITEGMRVAFDPWIPCGSCKGCRGLSPVPDPSRSLNGPNAKRAALRCHSPIRLGIERDGVFAETASVPLSNVYRVSESISPERAAYLEPVAASLGVLQAPITDDSRVLVYGTNRIATLTTRILKARTSAEIVCLPVGADLAPCEFDVVIETGLQPHTLESLPNALVPGGTLVLKSRSLAAVSFHPGHLVSRSLTLIAPAYGSYTDAAALLGDPSFALEDLFGETLPFTEFARAFELARSGESAKVFLAPD